MLLVCVFLYVDCVCLSFLYFFVYAAIEIFSMNKVDCYYYRTVRVCRPNQVEPNSLSLPITFQVRLMRPVAAITCGLTFEKKLPSVELFVMLVHLGRIRWRPGQVRPCACSSAVLVFI